MPSYFKYQRKQRNSALIVLLNIVVILAMWAGAQEYLPQLADQKAATQLSQVLAIAAPIVLLLLSLLAGYLWLNNKSFLLQVTPTTLAVNDPMFGDYSWQVKLNDIQRIAYSNEVDKKYRQIRVYLQDGSFHQLTQNYHYNRKQFYQALRTAAPHIIIEV